MCWKCGKPSGIDGKPGFRDICPVCGKDLHVCRNCAFFKPGVYRDCAETVPDPVTDKERMNLCEYFRLDPSKFSGAGPSKASTPGGGDGKAAFDKLFGNG